MLDIVSAGAAPSGYRAFLIVGRALWALVVSGLQGLGLAIIDDRERYRMLRYLYVTPGSLLVVLLGRGAARIGVGAVGAAITLGLAILLLGLDVEPAAIDWVLLGAALVPGVVAIVAMGVALAGVCLQVRQEASSYPEAVAGAMFLLCGVVFPLSVLPPALQAIGLALPLTWWIEATRRAILPTAPTAIGGEGSLWLELTGTSVPGPDILLATLSLSTVATIVLALAAYRWSERRAKDRGLLDEVTGS